MTTRIKGDQDFYVQNEDDLTGSGNTGAATGTATRTANINPDIGLATTKVAIDGDLQTIDTAAERLSLNPTANTSGAASNKHSGNFLLRWLAGLLQDVLNRLPSAKGQNAMADSVSVAIASNQSSIPVSDNSGSLTVDAPVSTPVFVRLSDGSSAIATLPVSASPYLVITDNPTIDTSAYANGDNLFGTAPRTLSSVVRASGGTGILSEITIEDASDQGSALDIIIFDRSVTLASSNGVWSVTGTRNEKVISFLGLDWVDNGFYRVATRGNLNLGVKPNSGSDLYYGVVVRGTPTYSSSALKFTFTFL